MFYVVFIAMIVEVTGSLIFLSISSHEGSLSSSLVLGGGFHAIPICWLSPHHARYFCCYWVVGFELPFVSPGYGFVHAVDGCAVGYIVFSQLCFISVLLVG
jgi:hypothetical protein